MEAGLYSSCPGGMKTRQPTQWVASDGHFVQEVNFTLWNRN